MGIMKNYEAGVNLGGWLSQYKEFSHDHFKTFITKKDIEKIASWGMDHVRLPIDYPVLEDENNPMSYKEDGFEYIDNCIEWCNEYGLNIILDIHSAPGYFFGNLDRNTLFTDENMQLRFMKLWETIAKRYTNEKTNVIFELLNEVVEPDSTRWNKLIKRLVASIRAIDKDRYIMIGGNCYNSIDELKNLDILDDDKTIYTFHFYLPFAFTHQKAYFVELMALANQTVYYPSTYAGIKDFAAANPNFSKDNHFYKMLEDLEGIEMNKEYLRKLIQPAIDFINKTGKELYCGEYGVIDQAPAESIINWNRDFTDLLKEYGIARGAWTYKLMDFPLVDGNGDVISEELVKIVSSK